MILNPLVVADFNGIVGKSDARSQSQRHDAASQLQTGISAFSLHALITPCCGVNANEIFINLRADKFRKMWCKIRRADHLVIRILSKGLYGRRQTINRTRRAAGGRGAPPAGVAGVEDEFVARLLAILLAVVLVGAGPATRPATTVYELRKQVEAMQSQIDELRTEISSMRSEMEARRPATTQPAKDESTKPRVGMSIEEVNKLMRRDGILVYDDANGTSQYKWSIHADRGHYEGTQYVAEDKVICVWYATFEGGKITAVSRVP